MPHRTRYMPWAIVVLASLVIVVAGVWLASVRVRAERSALQTALLSEAEDIAHAMDAGLVGQLAFNLSDISSPAYRRLSNMLAGYGLVSPEHLIYLLSLRQDTLGLGPTSGAAPGQQDLRDAVRIPDQAHYKQLMRDGKAFILWPGAQSREDVITALAPVISPASGTVIAAVGIQVSERAWQGQLNRAGVAPLAVSGLAIALLVAGYLALQWRGRQPAARQVRWLHLETALVAVATVFVTAVVTLALAGVESRQREALFAAMGKTRVAAVQAEMREVQRNISALARFFESSEYVGREEFAAFVGPLTSKAVLTYEWVPLVNAGAMTVFETMARTEGMSAFQVWELDTAGQVRAASRRESYYPVFYAEPRAGNEATLGFDLGSEAVRARALALAASERLTTASEPVGLLQLVSPRWGILVFEPVTRLVPASSALASPAAGGEQPHQGFVVAVLQLDRLLEEALRPLGGDPAAMALDLVDLEAASGGSGLMVLASAPQGHTHERSDAVGAHGLTDERTERLVPLFAFGRALGLVYHPTEAASALSPLRTAPAVAVAGLSLGAILALVVGQLRQRETTLKRMVDERAATLAQSEAQYRALFVEALNPILVAEADGRFIDANGAALAYLERSLPELVGKRLWDLAPRSSRHRMSRSQAPFDLRRTVEADLQVGDKVKTLLLNVIPVTQGARSTLFAIGQDITDRKHSEDALQRRYAFERTLAAASSRFVGQVSYDTAVRDSLADIGALTGAGRAYLCAVGEDGTTISNTHEWCAPGVESQRRGVPSMDIENYAWWLERLGRGEVILIPDVEQMGEELCAERAALRAQSIRSLVALPVFVQGSLTGFVGLDNASAPGSWQSEDISLLGTFGEILSGYMERLRAEDARLELERQLLQSQKLESLGVLAGGIAHDFNNLLAAILGNLELARLDLEPNSPARLSLDESVAASLRAADLTRQMLAYSGKGHFVVTDLDLSTLVEENTHIFRSAIPRTATLDLPPARDLPRVRADAGQMQQLIMNLLSNAAEALDGGPGQVTLTTGVSRLSAQALTGNRAGQPLSPGEYVWLQVKDNGQGMDADTQSRMFDPFFSTREAGRGLGLGAVLGIVRGHKGGIWVQSEPGQGTAVRVAFPALPRPGQGQRDAIDTSRALQRLSGGVLVVDDEQTVRRVNSTVLERMGLRTMTASCGEEALAIYGAHSQEIDCVLLDLSMPGMDGVATLDALRKINPAVKAVLCTGYGEQVASERFRGLGLSGFLLKPFQISELRTVLESALRAN